MAEIPSHVRKLLDEHNWEDTLPRLLLFSLRRIRRITWHGAKGECPPAGKMAEDFVMSVIEKVFSGQRKWDPQAYPDLLKYLFGVIHSDINHLAESIENRSVMRPESQLKSTEEDKERAIEKFPSQTLSQEKILLGAEKQEKAEEFLFGFIDFLGDEQKLIDLVECIMDDFVRPKDIARKMQVEIKDINNMKKRMQRRLRDYQERLGDQKAEVLQGGE